MDMDMETETEMEQVPQGRHYAADAVSSLRDLVPP